MKVKEKKNVYMSGMGVSVLQGISRKNMARATFFLRDKIYSDKPKAGLTEPICNAVDEHRKYNISRPVEVYLLAKEIVVRDFGKGLSEEDVCNIFFQYFESTKDETNDAIGGFGIGAKAPGAYADQYYVESYFGGVKRTFVSIVQGYEAVVNKVYEGPCAEDDTGIAVRIPAPTHDMTEKFIPLLKDLYLMLGMDSPKPVFEVYSCNVETYTDIKKDTELKKWSFSDIHNLFGRSISRLAELGDQPIVTKNLVYYPGLAIIYTGQNLFRYPMFKSNSVLLYDGDMMYSADLDNKQEELISVLRDTSGNAGRSYYWSTRAEVILLFKRGELTPTPSREKIEQSPKLTKFITNKVKEISDKFAADIGKTIYNDLITGTLSIANIPSRMSDCVLASILSRKTNCTELAAVNYIYENYKSIFLAPRGSIWCFEATKESRDYVKVSRNKFTRERRLSFSELHGAAVFIVGQRTRSMHDMGIGLSKLSYFTLEEAKGEYIHAVCVDDMDEIRKVLFNNVSISDADADSVISKLHTASADDISNAVPVVKVVRKKSDDGNTVQVKKGKELTALGHKSLIIDERNVDKTIVVGLASVDEDILSLSRIANDIPSSAVLNQVGNVAPVAQEVTGFKFIASVPAGDVDYWKSMGATAYDKSVIADKVKEYVKKNNIIYARDKTEYLSTLSLVGAKDVVIALARPVLSAVNCSNSSVVKDVYGLDVVMTHFAPDMIISNTKVVNIFDSMKVDKSMSSFITYMILKKGSRDCYIPTSVSSDVDNIINAYVSKSSSFATRFAKNIIKSIVK